MTETVRDFLTRVLNAGLTGLSADDGYTLLRLAQYGGEAIGMDAPAPPFVGPDDPGTAPDT